MAAAQAVAITKVLDFDEMASLAQLAFFRPHLAEILKACRADSLDLLVLKGAALAETVYPRPSLRPYGDLDVLVRGKDASRAKAILESLGYIVEPSVWNDLLYGRYCQANFFKHTPRGPVVIELHTDLLNNPLFARNAPIVSDGLWERARPARLAETEAWALGPEDQLLHLCLHLAGHYLAAPQSVRDIAQVCTASVIEWPLLIRLAREAEATVSCFCGLLAAFHLFKTPIPSDVLEALAPRVGRSQLEQIALARVKDGSANHPRFSLLWHLLENPARRQSAIKRVLFPTHRWLSAHYEDDFAVDSMPSHLSLQAAHLRFLMRSAGRVMRREGP